MVRDLGKALEDISRATGSVAHFYKTLDMSENGSSAKVDLKGNESTFQALIDEVKSVQQRGSATRQQEEEKKQSEAAAQPERNRLDSMPDPLEGLTGLINQMEFIALVMGNYA